jgi:hypothetical protein
MFNKPYPQSPAAEDAAVDRYWDEFEALDVSQFEPRWSEAIERARKRNRARWTARPRVSEATAS